MNYLDWGLKVSAQNPNFNSVVLPLPFDAKDYNYNFGWMADPDGKLAANGHLSDIGKLPNHPTFSNESVYAFGNPNAGRWIEPLNPAAPWRYHNPGRGLYMAPEHEAYPQTSNLLADYKNRYTGNLLADYSRRRTYPITRELNRGF